MALAALGSKAARYALQSTTSELDTHKRSWLMLQLRSELLDNGLTTSPCRSVRLLQAGGIISVEHPHAELEPVVALRKHQHPYKKSLVYLSLPGKLELEPT